MATVYEVVEYDGNGKIVSTRAIAGNNPAQVIRFASKGRFKADAISAARLGELFVQGVKAVEVATRE